MLIELLTDFFNGFSPFYFYVTVLLSTVAAIKFIRINNIYFVHTNMYAQNVRLISFYSIQSNHLIEKKISLHLWISRIMKRIEAPEDDTDDYSASFYKERLLKRGGKQWTSDPYSHFLKNIA